MTNQIETDAKAAVAEARTGLRGVMGRNPYTTFIAALVLGLVLGIVVRGLV